MVFQKLVWLTAGQPQEWESCPGSSVSKCLIPRPWEALPSQNGRIGKLNRQKSFKMLGVCTTAGRDYMVGVAGALLVLWCWWVGSWRDALWYLLPSCRSVLLQRRVGRRPGILEDPIPTYVSASWGRMFDCCCMGWLLRPPPPCV